MAIKPSSNRETRQAHIIEELLRERGIGRYGLFLVSSEGRELPGGGESASGYVVDSDGRVFFFWLDWDEAQECAVFSTWRRAEPDGDWLEEREYREALEVAGVKAP